MEAEPHLISLASAAGDYEEGALVRWPINGTGYRLWKLIQAVLPNFTDFDYLREFKRKNLCKFPAPDSADTLQYLWVEMERMAPPGATLVGLGVKIREAAGLPPELSPMKFVGRMGRLITWIPNPAGRNHYYNDPEVRLAVGLFLANLVKRP